MFGTATKRHSFFSSSPPGQFAKEQFGREGGRVDQHGQKPQPRRATVTRADGATRELRHFPVHSTAEPNLAKRHRSPCLILSCFVVFLPPTFQLVAIRENEVSFSRERERVKWSSFPFSCSSAPSTGPTTPSEAPPTAATTPGPPPLLDSSWRPRGRRSCWRGGLASSPPRSQRPKMRKVKSDKVNALVFFTDLVLSKDSDKPRSWATTMS